MSLLIVAFLLIACNSKTPEQQFAGLIQVSIKNKAKMKELGNLANASGSVKAVESLDAVIQEIKAVKVSDAEIK